MTRFFCLGDDRACRVCGCTELRACQPFSCWWVEADLCSECVGKSPSRRASSGAAAMNEPVVTVALGETGER